MNAIDIPSNDAKTSPMKILIVDDHVLVRQGIVALFGQLYPGSDVVEASNAAEALAAAEATEGLNLVLLDLTLPGDDGFDLLARLAAMLPETPVAVVSASDRSEDIAKAYRNGAKGYIVKSSSAEVLSHALPIILSGETYVPAAALEALSNPAAPMRDGAAAPGAPSLTPRQREILILIAEGLQNKEIAEKLNTVEGTIKVHVKTILEKLGVGNRTFAVVTGIRLGLIPADIVLPRGGVAEGGGED